MDNGVARISRHVQNLQERPHAALASSASLRPFIPGMTTSVRRSWTLLVRVQQTERIFGIGCFEDVVSERLECFHDVAAYVGIILDNEDAFSGTAAAGFRFAHFRRLELCQRTAASRC